jgi:hypothetical protein
MSDLGKIARQNNGRMPGRTSGLDQTSISTIVSKEETGKDFPVSYPRPWLAVEELYFQK